ncbi:MAG: DNA alkylation repair protein [Candidatus Moraniibacteriota bacterium]|nr:MAG: DNA alkylation repair protein [Candidatus Moranbacteria bacterium]
MQTTKILLEEVKALSDPDRAIIFARFFKSGPSQYGEGDKFLGIMVPQVRQLVGKYYRQLEHSDLDQLLSSPYHEIRLFALLVLVKKYQQTKLEEEKTNLYKYYLANRVHINNWDLVDVTTPQLVGDYLLTHPRDILYQLASSDNLWERRISIMATFAFIRAGEYEDTIKISKILLHDSHDLIHKAVGWMLREMGKKDKSLLINYLNESASVMPRTMLRYSIEKLTEAERQYYLKKKR